MNTDWQNYIEHQFSKKGLEGISSTQAYCVNRSGMGFLKVAGPDAETFLQGHITQDIKNITDKTSKYTAHCTHQGQVVNYFRILRHDNAYYLMMPMDTLEISLQHLQKYALFSKVVISNASQELVCIAYSAPAENPNLLHLSNYDLTLPKNPDEIQTDGEIYLIHNQIPGRLYEIIGPISAMKLLCTELSKQEIPCAPTTHWERLEIDNGIPRIHPQTSMKFQPHYLNLDKLNAISFTKGCYLGQEIIARMQYKGKLKQHLYPIKISSFEQPQPGDPVYPPNKEEVQSVGIIVSSTHIAENEYLCLAVVNDESLALFQI